MIVGVSGTGHTGSGAVVDLCREFSDVSVIDSLEFKISYMQDGLEDLAYHLIEHPVRFYSSDTAIRRFINLTKFLNKKYGPLTKGQFLPIVEEFISEIVQLTWRGLSTSHRIRIAPLESFFRFSIAERIRKFLWRYLHVWCSYPDIDMFLSINPENFYESAQNFILKILDSMSVAGDCIVLNQAFPGDRPEFSFPFYRNPKAICVSRDPRDVYILSKTVIKDTSRFIPTDDVYAFITYYRAIMKNSSNSPVSNSILRIRYEDLGYRYSESVNSIMKFINCENHATPKKYFNPEVGIANTNLVKRFPHLGNEIETIEKSLVEYLYPFDEIKENASSKRMKIF